MIQNKFEPYISMSVSSTHEMEEKTSTVEGAPKVTVETGKFLVLLLIYAII